MIKPNIQHPEQEKIDKLPKWASAYIANLRREVEYTIARCTELETERNATPYGEQSLGSITWEVALDGEHIIPDRARLKFIVGDTPQHWLGVRLSTNHKNERVIDVSGSGAYSIEPRAANGVWIKLVD